MLMITMIMIMVMFMMIMIRMRMGTVCVRWSNYCYVNVSVGHVSYIANCCHPCDKTVQECWREEARKGGSGKGEGEGEEERERERELERERAREGECLSTRRGER